MAASEITDTTRIANVGVANLTETCPNTLRGRMPSRPIANRMRATDACDVSAEPMQPATYAAVKKMLRNSPPGGQHHVQRTGVDVVELRSTGTPAARRRTARSR